MAKQQSKKTSSAQKPARNPDADIFIVLAYDVLRGDGNGGKYPTLHAVWSGFNTAFRAVFSKTDPVAYMKMLAEDGLLEIKPHRGGVTIAPMAGLLRKLSDEEHALSTRLRSYLTDFHVGHLAAKAARAEAKKKLHPEPETQRVTKPKLSAAEKQAEKLWDSGETSEALAKLNY